MGGRMGFWSDKQNIQLRLKWNEMTQLKIQITNCDIMKIHSMKNEIDSVIQ